MPLRDAAARFARELSIASAAVLLLGLGAAGQGASPELKRVTTTLAADAGPAPHAVAPQPAPVRARVPVAVARRPKSAPAPGKAAVAAESAPPVARWLPTGTGMWIHDWSRTEGGHAPQVVARAQAAGLTHLFVQTGSSKKGWIGQPVLSQLLPATAGTDLRVVAWDFPKLVDPEDDARRLAKAAWWRRPGVPMVAAVAPDIETLAEGTHASRDSINRYYRTLRQALPARVAILSTVPWPSEKRINRYPYTRTARYADAFIPMAYWYNRSPSVVTATSMAVLRQFGKPVFPVGQGYDGRLDAPYLAPDPAPGRSVDAFVRTARASGASSISLWSWQTTGAQQWSALHRASATYAPPAPAPVVQPTPATPSSPAPKTKASKPGWHPGKGR
ncbi:MAG: Peptidoglycan-binding domain 1 protein [Frankiales bacterium]|nr:Peptidoglycan-binding domain 1 protein [Frankiales bacterium]